MSEQKDAFLQTNASYNFSRQKLQGYGSRTIQPELFTQWTKEHMYKSSYAHFHSRDSLQSKTTAMPGYQGHIPSVQAENLHGKGFSAIARESFQNDRLGANPLGLSSTGYNLNREALVDHSKVATSSRYGKSQIQRAHPGWNAEWRSTSHEAFKNPAALVSPTYRQTDKWLQTQRPQTKTSGYATNHSEQDGKGWKPDPVLKGDLTRTEYRDRFNADHPFHRDPNISVIPKLRKKDLNYRFN